MLYILPFKVNSFETFTMQNPSPKINRAYVFIHSFTSLFIHSLCVYLKKKTESEKKKKLSCDSTKIYCDFDVMSPIHST